LAEKTNLIASDRPSDLYTDVCNQVETRLELVAQGTGRGAALASALLASGFLSRKIVKSPSMTTTYSSTPRGRKDAVLDVMFEDREKLAVLRDRENPEAAAKYLVTTIDDVLRELIPGAFVGMKYFRDVARVVAETGLDLRWTSPTGFVVHQIARKPLRHPVRTERRRVRFDVTLAEDGSEPSPREAMDAVAPSFVHSLDAAVLVKAVTKLERDVGVVHDCVRVRPCDAEAAQRALLWAMEEIFRGDPLMVFHMEIEALLHRNGRTDAIAALPSLPTPGTYRATPQGAKAVDPATGKRKAKKTPAFTVDADDQYDLSELARACWAFH
jgi:DNA-directed RNA polymerase